MVRTMVGEAALQAGIPVVFLHSSNQQPCAAWPFASQVADARFAFMPGYDLDVAVPFDQDAWEARLLDACADAAVVIAHSFGGPIAMRAALRRPDLVKALVLFEPAAYALGRGLYPIEAHIARMQPVLDRADRLAAPDFITEFIAAMTGTAPSRPASADALIAAERQRMLPGPWTLDTPAETGRPVLVITGEWNDEYELIAEKIPGSRHVILSGHGHRPQDHPLAGRTVLQFMQEF